MLCLSFTIAIDLLAGFVFIFLVLVGPAIIGTFRNDHIIFLFSYLQDSETFKSFDLIHLQISKDRQFSHLTTFEAHFSDLFHLTNLLSLEIFFSTALQQHVNNV